MGAARLARCKLTLRIVDPLGDLDFQTFQRCAKMAVAVSGAFQEEATWLGTPPVSLCVRTRNPLMR